MILNALDAQGLPVSKIGLGSLHFGVFLDERQAKELVHKALDENIFFFDTAPIYGGGRAESILGNALRGKRSRAVISTKVGLAAMTHPDGRFGVRVERLTKGFLKTSVESSLRALRIDTIDLLQLHAFDHQTPIFDLFQGLEELIKEGKIKYFGSSNYNHVELQILLKSLPASLRDRYVSFQMHYNLLERRAEEELIPLCARNRIGIIVNRALARGILSGKYVQVNEPPARSRGATSPRVRETITTEIIELVSMLSEFAQSNGRSCSELALSWLMRRPEISTVLVGVRDGSQLRTCVNACTWHLSPNQLVEIEKIIDKSHFRDRVRQLPEYFFEQ